MIARPIPPKGIPDASTHREELRVLHDAVSRSKNPRKSMSEVQDTNLADMAVDSGTRDADQSKQNPLMDRSELAGELVVILTVSTLMLGVVFSLMCSVNRDEITAAIEEDRAQCKISACTVQPAYDSYIFLTGSVCAEICGGCMIMVTFVQFSFNLLSVESWDVVAGTVQYHTYRNVIQAMYCLLFIAFILGAYCGINVIFVKIRSYSLQVCVLNISYVFWCLVATMVLYVARNHMNSKKILVALKKMRDSKPIV